MCCEKSESLSNEAAVAGAACCMRMKTTDSGWESERASFMKYCTTSNIQERHNVALAYELFMSLMLMIITVLGPTGLRV